MAVDIGPKIGIQGEREFRNQIQQINQSMKTLAAEGEAVASAFDDNTTAEKKATAQKELLNRQIETQKDKLALLERGLNESAKMYGEADSRTLKWQQAVHEATATLNNMERELSELDKDVDDTTDSMKDAGAAASGWADVMKGQLLADAVKAGLSKVLDMAKGIASAMWSASEAGAAYADEISTLAATTGLSTEKLQEYRYMAELTDVSLETITGSLTKLTRSMNSASEGKGEAAEAFAELGIAVKDSSGKLRDSKTVFNEIITALGKIENETERDAKAMTIFGKSAKELNPLIKTGAKGLDDLAREAHDAGYVLSGEALKALNAQQDAQDRLAKKTEALSNRFAAGLAPSVERAASKLDEMASSPKVRQAMDDASKAIGSVIDEAVGLAEKALPYILDFFGLFDDKIRIYTDEQLALMQETDDLAQAHADLINEYKTKAQAIVDETDRIKDLWNELKTLVDQNGKVQKANEDRVKFISNELNEALGTQLTLEGRTLQNYLDQADAIDKLIKKREAEALLAAGAGEFASIEKEKEKYLLNAAKYQDQIVAATERYFKAIEAHNEAGANLFKDITDETGKELNDAKAALNELVSKYESAQAEYQKMYAESERYSRAQRAAATENYGEVVRILADEMGITLEYYTQKEQLSEKDKENLRAKIEDAKAMMAEYKIALDEGATGFSEAGLKEWEEYTDDLQAILEGRLDDVKRIGRNIGEAYGMGVASGIAESESAVLRAAEREAAQIRDRTKSVLSIASPSKVAKWMGRMWDEGLIKGMEDNEKEVARAAGSLAKTIMQAGAVKNAPAFGYVSGQTAAPLGSYNAENAYTTNLGGITIRVDGAGVENEDVLANRIVARLTSELNRARRASG